MKILPAILDDISDFGKVGNEFYFKKQNDIEFQNVDENKLNQGNLMKTAKTLFDSTEPSITTRTRTKTTSVHTSGYGKAIEHDDDDGTKNPIENGITDISNTVDDTNRLRDVRSTLITPYDEVNTNKYHSISSRQPAPTAGTVQYTQRSSTINQWNDDLNTAVFETRPDDIDVGIDILNLSENQTKAELDAKIVRAKNDFTVIKMDRADIDRQWKDVDEDYDSDEDYEVEVDGARVWRKNKVRTHESYQKTGMEFRPLQQGFIASPGYPSYYIGSPKSSKKSEETQCTWRITVKSGQPIRLVLLDVDLRCKQQ